MATAVAGGTGLVRDGETLSVGYDIGLEDFVSFNMYHHSQSPGQRRMMLLVWGGGTLLFLAIAIVQGSIMVAAKHRALLPMTIFAALLTFVFAFVGPAANRWYMIRTIRRLYSEGRNASMFGSWRVIVSNARLSVFMPLVESHYHWEAIERLVRTPDAIYVYTSSVEAVIIPVRAFRDSADFGAIEQAIRVKMTPR